MSPRMFSRETFVGVVRDYVGTFLYRTEEMNTVVVVVVPCSAGPAHGREG